MATLGNFSGVASNKILPFTNKNETPTTAPVRPEKPPKPKEWSLTHTGKTETRRWAPQRTVKQSAQQPENKVIICRTLDNSQVSTTLDIYTHSFDTKRKEASRALQEKLERDMKS